MDFKLMNCWLPLYNNNDSTNVSNNNNSTYDSNYNNNYYTLDSSNSLKTNLYQI